MTAADEDAGAAPPRRGLFDLLGRVELRFAQACVVLMTALVLASAVSRTLGTPMNWTIDLALFMLAWAVFVGADVAWRRDRMVSIDLLVDRVPARVRPWVRMLNLLLIAVFLAAVIVTGTSLALDSSDRRFDGLGLSYTWVTLAVPAGCLLMLVTTAHKIRDQLGALRPGRETES